MDWQMIIVILIVAACARLAYRQIKKELTGQSKCANCAEAQKKRTFVQIDPPIENPKDKD
ncbi:MAG: hypothetical protein JXR73_13750 [Candidatus Omnitrophica bacterium]|nr:hypothetical protein [Candidatus Omnitrophota bacterium]